MPNDARRIHHAVYAQSPLDIPRNQLHQRMPVRRKLCTNCRWNSRNATSSGPDVINVAAPMIDQSIPWSGEAKMDRPTVSGLVSTELVMISGQMKLFQ